MDVVLAIGVDPATGQIGVQSSVPDLIHALGLLEAAKDLLKQEEVAKQQQGTKILLARGNLPANGNGR